MLLAAAGPATAQAMPHAGTRPRRAGGHRRSLAARPRPRKL